MELAVVELSRALEGFGVRDFFLLGSRILLRQSRIGWKSAQRAMWLAATGGRFEWIGGGFVRGMMLSMRLWKLGVLVAVVVGAGVVQRWVYGSRAMVAATIRPLPRSLSDIPHEIGTFHYHRDFELQPDVLRVAKVDSFLHREYMEGETNLPILLYVGYWGQPNTGLGHGPEVCFPAAGWTAEGGPSDRLIRFRNASNEEIEAKIAVHHFVRAEPEGIRRISVGFTAVVGGRFQPSSRGSFLHSPPGGTDASFVAHVQVGSSATEKEWTEADRRVVAFLEDALKPLSAVLFGQGTGQASNVGE